ncbi:MAG: hypothetical protein ACI8WB_003642 [Phenylobacterium sp.]|jgi:uncharacterized protein (DUF885 family)
MHKMPNMPFKTPSKTLIAAFVCTVLGTSLAGCGSNNSANSSANNSADKALNEQTVSASRAKIDAIIDRHTRDYMMLQPAMATALNLSAAVGGDYSRRLPDYSVAGFKQVQQTMGNAAKELNAIDLERLSDKDRLHVSVNKAIDAYFAGSADFSGGYIDTWGGHLPFVVNQISGPLIDIPTVLQDQHTISNRQDADNYLTRLAAFEVVVMQVLEKVIADDKAGIILPKKLFPNTLEYLNGFAAGQASEHSLITSFKERLNKVSGMDGKMREQYLEKATLIVQNGIFPAYAKVEAYMSKQQHRASDSDGIWAQPGGAEFYRHEIQYLGDSLRSPDEIHQIGLDEVARITEEMDLILKDNGKRYGTVGQRMLKMNDEARFLYEDSDEGREKLLAGLRKDVDTIMEKAPMLFATLPKMKVVVKRIPVVREKGAAGGYYQPPALDGSRDGEYYINLYDMKSNPSFGLKTLTYHEAVPGHHFQAALNMEQKDLGIMRQNGQFNAYVEGWALYSELLAEEMGMYEDDPWGDLGRLQAELYRAARLVVDTGLHHKRWSRKKTTDYFSETTGTIRSAAEGAINRYMAWPGQALGYKLGMLKLVELRAWAKAELGDKFDIKVFHDVVLLAGSRPLPILEDDIKRWIKGYK